eukprot:6463373-Amphidinium_carterae.1
MALVAMWCPLYCVTNMRQKMTCYGVRRRRGHSGVRSRAHGATVVGLRCPDGRSSHVVLGARKDAAVSSLVRLAFDDSRHRLLGTGVWGCGVRAQRRALMLVLGWGEASLLGIEYPEGRSSLSLIHI